MSEAFATTPRALLDAKVCRGANTQTHTTQSSKGYDRRIAKQAGKAEGGEGGRRPQAEILGVLVACFDGGFLREQRCEELR